MVNLNDLEHKWLKYWKEYKIFEKSLSKRSPQGNFVFFEGPPTANGKPGIHHVLARAYKDLILRYKTMRGFRVDRKAGWDTQGLPVELQVEKALGFRGKPDIEKYGVEEFNAKCRESVWQYKEEWEKLTERMGYWLDMNNPYVTYERPYIESLWWIFKQIDKAGLLYQDYKVLPHCPRCGTALSSHEVALGYKSVPDKAVYVKFKVKDQPDTYILSWTTTPWTLPGNVALAVGDDIDYIELEVETSDVEDFYKGDKIIIARPAFTNLFGSTLGYGPHPYEGDHNWGAANFKGKGNVLFKNIKQLKGRDLVGLEYEPLFDIKPLQNENSYKVYPADFVTTTDGTGVVHTAVMYGEDDFNLGSEVGLPKYHTVDEAGKFTADVRQWQGKFVKDKEVEDGIVADLKKRGLLLAEEIYEHDYPFCWRCATPLLYYAKPSWFIKMSALKDELKAGNAKINWYPEHIKQGRFGEWLEGIKDWAVSRERYWGTPLPIWRCTECKHQMVIGGLSELAKISGQEKVVGDNFDPHRPFIDEVKWSCKSCGGEGEMKRVPEVADCWFDSGSMPFAQWGYPHTSNSQENFKNHYPAEYISEAIDQTRGWFYTLLAVATLLKKAGAITEVPPYRNVICLGHINDKDGQKMSKSKGNIVDPWAVMNTWGADALRFHLFTANQPGEPKNFDTADVDQVVKKTMLILLNVVTFYEIYKNTDKVLVQMTNSTQVMDKWILALLQQLINETTEHLDKYEVTEAGRKITRFVTDLSTWYVRRSRDRFKEEGEDKQAALTTLNYVLVTLAKLIAPFAPFIADEVYSRVGGQEESVHLADWPASNKFDEQIVFDMVAARAVVEQALAARAKAGIKIRQPLRKLKASVPDELQIIVAEEVNVMEIVKADTFELDMKIDEELKEAGLIREFTRQVNALRKELKLTIHDKVNLTIQAPESLQSTLVNKLEEIKRAVIAESIEFSDKPQEHKLDFNDLNLSIGISK